MKWNLIFDVALCENCNNCVLATKDEYVDNDFPGYSAAQPRHGAEWIEMSRRVRGEAPMVDAAYLVTTCNQCDNAPCVKAGKGGAVFQREDGIVIIDPVKAKGQRKIVDSCPYGAIKWNEDLDIPQKWIFDAHLLDQGWKEPRCVQACPTGALRALKVSDEEMRKIVLDEDLRVLGEEYKTRPRVYYKNLGRYTHAFLGGSVSHSISERQECVPNAAVSLVKAGELVASTNTDTFGDFKFDNLPVDSGTYEVKVSHSRLGMAACKVDLKGSVYIGVLSLSKSPHNSF